MCYEPRRVLQLATYLRNNVTYVYSNVCNASLSVIEIIDNNRLSGERNTVQQINYKQTCGIEWSK